MNEGCGNNMNYKEGCKHKFVDVLFFRDIDGNRYFEKGSICCECLQEVLTLDSEETYTNVLAAATQN